uniref:Biogenesis of lysosome-related organelles complex 1 subunit 7 n=1 Tax=Heterorhabditis bacteriophora TaxID=37862 RepID=A0A1I7XJ89_HETBA
MEDGLIPEANTGTLAAEVPSVDDDKDSTTDQCSNARSSSALPCEMCQNYEINLTIIQLSAQIEDMIKEAVKNNSVHENRLLDLLENNNRRRELSSKQLTEMNAICSKLESDIQQLTKNTK